LIEVAVSPASQDANPNRSRPVPPLEVALGAGCAVDELIALASLTARDSSPITVVAALAASYRSPDRVGRAVGLCTASQTSIARSY
jgi:hypothetical protein